MLEFVDPSTGVTRFSNKEVGSTNDEAFKIAKERGGDLFFVTAEKQTKGRGRLGRKWTSDEGNLFLSLFCRNPGKVEVCSTLSFVAAVAVREAIEECVGTAASNPCKHKWPNDILWGGAKISGILLEMRRNGEHSDIVIGIGVNCVHFPEDTPYPATSFRREGIDLDGETLMSSLQRSLLSNLTLWDRGAGFEMIRKKWISHAHKMGDEIVVKSDGSEKHGLFRGLDSKGQLIFAQPGKADEYISAGDVFFSPQSRNE